MRIKILCQNRVGLLRDILDLLLESGVDVVRGEVGGKQGDAIYLACPDLVDQQLQALMPRLQGIGGVSEVEPLPGERRCGDADALPGGFSLDGSLGEIVGRFEKAVLQRLLGEYPSSRLLARRLGVSHTTIANKLRQHGLRCTPDEGPSGKG
ncbi:transcriptional regulator of aroF, aroG, tyrA and aromatic amino acid transport [Azotobacter chroococcum]|uniref:Transcriptional regulator of aroF, aroG, tyrA and aromatic amino acid transport n=1 Tax=Azotobacter chroococcum TaxID=353 RepID=A0A4V2Q4L3_9GAMM|nr:TyrR/PhhR family helix-turn-helix DNA-binding protein [Azotobacter chroococcum]TBV92754.1 hypothetical protein E0E53_18060 [Azotobacter chroococcum]TCL15527.1 transcriptional regulator of aroF, aroG, tyrA and aromatic amino acid transport [Azotobacter chroococcum]